MRNLFKIPYFSLEVPKNPTWQRGLEWFEVLVHGVKAQAENSGIRPGLCQTPTNLMQEWSHPWGKVTSAPLQSSHLGECWFVPEPSPVLGCTSPHPETPLSHFHLLSCPPKAAFTLVKWRRGTQLRSVSVSFSSWRWSLLSLGLGVAENIEECNLNNTPDSSSGELLHQSPWAGSFLGPPQDPPIICISCV